MDSIVSAHINSYKATSLSNFFLLTLMDTRRWFSWYLHDILCKHRNVGRCPLERDPFAVPARRYYTVHRRHYAHTDKLTSHSNTALVLSDRLRSSSTVADVNALMFSKKDPGVRYSSRQKLKVTQMRSFEIPCCAQRCSHNMSVDREGSIQRHSNREVR